MFVEVEKKASATPGEVKTSKYQVSTVTWLVSYFKGTSCWLLGNINPTL